jgi:multiple sugar transport system substrate-binding protein
MFAEKLSRRSFIQTTALAGVGAALAACAPKAEPTATPAPKAQAQPTQPPTAVPAPAEGVTLRWMVRMGADLIPGATEIIETDFYAANPGIKVTLEPAPEGWVEKLLAQMIAGTAVDLFQAWGNIFYNWTERGLLLDCQPFVERDLSQAEIDEYNEFQWEGLVMKGVRVGMPKYINLMTISINKDLFDKYGVAYPPDDGNWTRADYQALMENLLDKARSAGDENVWPGHCPMWSWDRFWGPVHSFGGKIVDEKYGKKCLIAEPMSIEALQFMYDLEWTSNVHAQPSQIENKNGGNALAGGFVMSTEDGTYPMNRERLWGEEAGIRWDMRHVPKGPRGGRSVLGTTDAWSITKQTQFPEESWKLLSFISGPVFQEKHVVRQAGIIPVLKGLISNFIDTVRSIKPRMEDVRLETIKEILDWGYAEDSPWYCDTVAATDLIKPALEAVYTSGSQAPDYFASVAEAVDASQANCTP